MASKEEEDEEEVIITDRMLKAAEEKEDGDKTGVKKKENEIEKRLNDWRLKRTQSNSSISGNQKSFKLHAGEHKAWKRLKEREKIDAEHQIDSSRSSSSSVFPTATTVSDTAARSFKRKQTTHLNQGGKEMCCSLHDISDSINGCVICLPHNQNVQCSPSSVSNSNFTIAVLKAIKNASIALEEATDFALAASNVADKAYSAAKDTAESARALMTSLQIVKDALQSLHD